MNSDHTKGGIIGAVATAVLALILMLAQSKGIEIQCPNQEKSAVVAPASSK